MRADYWRELVRRWVLIEEGIGSPEFLTVERAGLLREAIAALTSEGDQTRESGGSISPDEARAALAAAEKHPFPKPQPPVLNKSGGSDVEPEWSTWKEGACPFPGCFRVRPAGRPDCGGHR